MLGPSELGIIFLAILILFGPQKIPELARSIGKAIGEYKLGYRESLEKLEKKGKEKEPKK